MMTDLYIPTLYESFVYAVWKSQTCDRQTCGTSEFDAYDTDLAEMAGIRERQSGIPYHIFVSSANAVHHRHGPRIKVSNVKGTFDHNDNFVITIPALNVIGPVRIKTTELDHIKDWVVQNQEVLLQFWKDEIDEQDLLNNVVKV